jgi:hypothetical protein
VKYRVLLVLFGVGLSLLLLEGALRLQEWAQMNARIGRTKARARLYQPDPDLEWFHRPGAESIASSPGEFRLPVRINSQGLHDREYRVARTPGSTRILFLGDSFLQALQVPAPQSAQDLIEEGLTRRLESSGRGPVEVINAGVAGYGPGHELLLYRRMAPVWQPDLVLVLLCMGNDVEDESPQLAQRVFLSGIEHNVFFEIDDGRPVSLVAPRAENLSPYAPTGHPVSNSKRPAYLALHKALALHSRVYRLVTSRLLGNPWLLARLGRMGVAQTPFLPSKYARNAHDPPYEEALTVVKALLLQMAVEAHRNGSAFGVAIVPELAQVRPEVVLGKFARSSTFQNEFDPQKTSRDLGVFLASRNIPCLDLWPSFRDEERRTGEPLYFRRDGHLNALGHRVMARALEEWLLDSRLLDSRLLDSRLLDSGVVHSASTTQPG